jgi:hypothetical protein
MAHIAHNIFFKGKTGLQVCGRTVPGDEHVHDEQDDAVVWIIRVAVEQHGGAGANL